MAIFAISMGVAFAEEPDTPVSTDDARVPVWDSMKPEWGMSPSESVLNSKAMREVTAAELKRATDRTGNIKIEHDIIIGKGREISYRQVIPGVSTRSQSVYIDQQGKIWPPKENLEIKDTSPYMEKHLWVSEERALEAVAYQSDQPVGTLYVSTTTQGHKRTIVYLVRQKGSNLSASVDVITGNVLRVGYRITETISAP